MRKIYDFGSIEALEAMGFRGFEKVSVLNDLRRQRKLTRRIGKEIGLYMVVWPFSHRPKLLPSEGLQGHYSVPCLKKRWIDGAIVAYIGETHGDSSDLSTRIGAYLRHGVNGYGDHGGGKAIWQLDGSDDLKFCWRAGKLIDGKGPFDAETIYLDEFKKIYGRIPFANVDPKGV